MLTKEWGAHENGYQTLTVPPHAETPACYSLYFKPFCWSGSPAHPGCWEPGTCQQHAPPRKSAEDAFLQPLRTAAQILFMARFWVSPTLPLRFRPPFLLPDEGHETSQGRYRPTPGRSPAVPTKHSNLPSSTCLHVQQFYNVTIDKVTFGINWGGTGCK